MNKVVVNVNAMILGVNKKAWNMDGKTGIAYSGSFLLNGQVLVFRCTEEIYNVLEKFSEKYGDIGLYLEAQEKLVKLWVVSFQPSK